MRFAWIRRLTYPRCRLRLAVNRIMGNIKLHWENYLQPTRKKSSGPVGVCGGRWRFHADGVCVEDHHHHPDAKYGCVCLQGSLGR